MEQATCPKYARPEPIHLPDRQWPSRELTKSPLWTSVDLRDGNQALPNPLNPAQKLEYFELLCRVGFKPIEVSFPSASRDDFEFTQRLIGEKRIPQDVSVMGLTQCREHLIERTFEAMRGVGGSCHAYCAATDLHMSQVFGPPAGDGGDGGQGRAADPPTRRRHGRQRHPIRVFAGGVHRHGPGFRHGGLPGRLRAWGRATAAEPLILNLPATVERRPPNHYADMIELFCRRFPHRSSVLVSLHAHNDQGMAVAATELAVWPAGTAWRARCSGTGSGRATWTS